MASTTISLVASTKSLSDPRMAHARKFTSGVVRDDFGGNVSAAAKAWKVSQAQLADFLNKRGGVGLKLLEAVADHAKVQIDAVIGRSTSELVSLPLDLLDNRRKAAEAARALGYAQGAIEFVLAQTRPANDLTPREWIVQIAAAEASLMMGPPSGPPTKQLGAGDRNAEVHSLTFRKLSGEGEPTELVDESSIPAEAPAKRKQPKPRKPDKPRT